MIKKYVSDLKREFAGYSAASLLKDMMAGLTVCAVALPLALAFGVSSGASAAAGMVTAIIGGIVIGLLSGASYQISGPTGAMSAILISVVAQYGMQGMFAASLAAGIILLLCGLLRLGKLINFIPSPVIMGFTSGIAVVIALGQVDNFFGTVSEGATNMQKLLSYGRLGFHPQWESVVIGALAMAVMIFWPRKWNEKVPSSLVAVIVASQTASLSGMQGLRLVGDIPKSLLLEQRLSLESVDLTMMKGLISPVISIAALGMIESLLCGLSASRMKHEPFDADRELVAQGIGNILLPFFGGVPATAAIARSGVAVKSGQQTRLTGIFHSLFLLAAMLALGPVMAKLPLAALAGVLMMTAWKMNEWGEIRYIFRHRFWSAISEFLLTMVATVVFDLMTAVALGVIYSALLFMVSSSRITVSFSAYDPQKLHEAGKALSGRTQVAYITGPVFFAALHTLTDAFAQLPACDNLVISMRGVPSMDVSGARTLLEWCAELREQGIRILFCGVQDAVRGSLERSDVHALLGEDCFYWSAEEAFAALAQTDAKR